jgi:hypothetical protein
MRLLPALLAAAALVLAAAGCSGDGGEQAPPPGRALATSRELTPTAHLFGDVVHARLDVIVDRDKLDPDRVSAVLDFLPYRIQGGIARTRDDFSHFSRLRWEATLRCITIACVPSRLQSVLGGQEGRGERRTYRFKPARVLYDGEDTTTAKSLRQVFWPPLDAISRLSPDEAQIPSYASLGPGGEFRATLAPVGAPSYRVPAWLLAAALLAAAAALLALPVTLVVRELRRRRPQPETEERLSPLEQALRRVEHVRDHGDAEEQREALEALAFELDGDGRASRVRALAWRPSAPQAEETTALVAELRRADGVPA